MNQDPLKGNAHEGQHPSSDQIARAQMAFMQANTTNNNPMIMMMAKAPAAGGGPSSLTTNNNNTMPAGAVVATNGRYMHPYMAAMVMHPCSQQHAAAAAAFYNQMWALQVAQAQAAHQQAQVQAAAAGCGNAPAAGSRGVFIPAPAGFDPYMYYQLQQQQQQYLLYQQQQQEAALASTAANGGGGGSNANTQTAASKRKQSPKNANVVIVAQPSPSSAMASLKLGPDSFTRQELERFSPRARTTKEPAHFPFPPTINTTKSEEEMQQQKQQASLFSQDGLKHDVNMDEKKDGEQVKDINQTMLPAAGTPKAAAAIGNLLDTLATQATAMHHLPVTPSAKAVGGTSKSSSPSPKAAAVASTSGIDSLIIAVGGVDDHHKETMSAAKPQHKKRERWSEGEHTLFLQGLKTFGRKWTQIQTLLPHKTTSQIRVHAYSYFSKANTHASVVSSAKVTIAGGDDGGDRLQIAEILKSLKDGVDVSSSSEGKEEDMVEVLQKDAHQEKKASEVATFLDCEMINQEETIVHEGEGAAANLCLSSKRRMSDEDREQDSVSPPPFLRKRHETEGKMMMMAAESSTLQQTEETMGHEEMGHESF